MLATEVVAPWSQLPQRQSSSRCLPATPGGLAMNYYMVQEWDSFTAEHASSLLNVRWQMQLHCLNKC